MRLNLLAAALCFFTACATVTPPVVDYEGELDGQFCRLATERGRLLQNELESKSAGVAVSVHLISCNLLAPDLGRIAYLVQAYTGNVVSRQIEFVGVMALVNGDWTVVRQGPIYAIDYLNKRFEWFVQDVSDPSKTGTEI